MHGDPLAYNEALRVLGLRAEAFGSGTPIADWQTQRTYHPDCSVTEWKSYPTLQEAKEARERERGVYRYQMR